MTSSHSVRRRRGRPRAFDQETVDAAILGVFWKHGFGSATVDHLSEATGLNRPSLYKVIGSKEEAYLAAVRRYLREQGQAYIGALRHEPNFARALSAFYEAYIETVCGRQGPGCPLGCALPVDSETLPAAKRLLAEALSEIDGAVVKRVKQAQKAGQLAPGIAAPDAARMIVNTMLAMSLRSRSGDDKRQLRQAARTLVALLTGGTATA